MTSVLSVPCRRESSSLLPLDSAQKTESLRNRASSDSAVGPSLSSSSSSSSLNRTTATLAASFCSSPPDISLRPLDTTTAEEDGFQFPEYDVACLPNDSQDEGPPTPTQPQDSPHVDQPAALQHRVADDTCIAREPTRQCDYLSHSWTEEDALASWRYVSARKDTLQEGERLEYAAWRSWAKVRCKARLVSPASINWDKDCDLTWLYGPWQTHDTPKARDSSPPSPSASVASAFLHKKSILKKRTASQALLQFSLSTRSLLRHAGAIAKAQREVADSDDGNPDLDKSTPDLSISGSRVESESTVSMSSASSIASEFLSPSVRRHISFNTIVKQCIAVDGDDDHHGNYYAVEDDDDLSDEDSVVMMKPLPSRPLLSYNGSPRSSFSSDSRTIAPLPSTTLKSCPEPELKVPKKKYPSYFPWFRPEPRSSLSRSSSTETLRPPKQNSHDNFLLDEDEEGEPEADKDSSWGSKWISSDTYARFDSSWFPSRKKGHEKKEESPEEETSYAGSSGVFVPFGYGNDGADQEESEEKEDEFRVHYGLFGKVIDTVNTARDIAHVIWNVGWST
ncbi:hypothetical protein VTO42DRAFT_6505 [Malbranchea cinnamomea]